MIDFYDFWQRKFVQFVYCLGQMFNSRVLEDDVEDVRDIVFCCIFYIVVVVLFLL